MKISAPSERAIEARARRAALAAGYVVHKSRCRRGSVDNYGGFMIVDPNTNVAVAGYRFDYDAEAVLQWLGDEG